MSCEDVKIQLAAHIAGECGAEESSRIEEHVGQCPSCSATLREFRSTLARLPKISQRPDAYWQAYSAEVIGRLQEKQPQWQGNFFRIAAVAALSLVMVGGATLYVVQERRKMEEIVSRLDLLDNLELLQQEQFDQWVDNEKS